ncbi:WHG domain-containing protein [Streptomyces sp. Go40/10]|uniref:TetR-like C-terminal domain-containing protein n=1 Tax=Streptomyces sp. Go40/10 TaxID=2825844 RepID=UPI001E361B98|nr:TetR-like C-terminal domain-containing protein [Streptomyces sp. Go40/10]UFR00240.1 WHG domain-containing protein [Streptomyces sp. Go40/10]
MREEEPGALDEARQLRLVDQGHGRVLHRDAAAAVSVEDRLVTTDPEATVALALRIRGHLHGLVSLEVYGHMHTQTTSPDKLFREELAQLLGMLGVPHRS